MAEHFTIDFETRSPTDLKTCGSWVYSQDPATEVLCMAFIFPGENDYYLWHPAFPHLGIEECELSPHPTKVTKKRLKKMFKMVKDGTLIEAHNVFFEKVIWNNRMMPDYGWPEIPMDRWRCSAAKASTCSLPRDLDGATRALGVAVDKQKSADGKKLMLRMCKPRKPRKAELKELTEEWGSVDLIPPLYYEDEDMLQRLFDYCGQDTIAEHELSSRIPDLTPFETRVWQYDQEINWHGTYFDRQMIQNALELIDICVDKLNQELSDITGGVLTKGTQRAKIKEYVNANSPLDIPDTRGQPLRRLLKDKDAMKGVSDTVRRVIEICLDVNRTSTAKFKGMLPKMPADNCIRDLLMYHGAGTGRWTGKGVQPHNFPRGQLKPKDSALAAKLIRIGDWDLINDLWPNLSVMEVLSSALRAAITCRPGKKLVVADYSSIEARVLVWLVGDDKALEIFHLGKDIYKDMAVSIYHVPYDEVTDEQRRMGKQAILGLGYQMGAKKFKATLWDSYDIDIPLELAQTIVDAYRERYRKVKFFWDNINECAIRAVKNKDKVIKCGSKLMFKYSKGFLRIRLPSGRCLYYCQPRVKKKALPWGGTADALTYMSVDGVTRKWVRTDTYGGKLTENVVQAMARDFMAHGLLNIKDHGLYNVLLSVHDELISECPADQGSYEEFEILMADLPDWGHGCPVAAEGWEGERYRK